MSRIIKFRAWIKNPYDVMVESEDILNFGLDCGKIIYVESEEHDMDRGTFELMQYTGLKDKHGLEVYEGDVVINKTKSLSGNGFSGKNIVFLVAWNEDECNYELQVKHKNMFGLKRLTKLTIKDFEVIGNIHQNTVLLSQ